MQNIKRIRINKYSFFFNAILFTSLLLISLCSIEEAHRDISIHWDPLRIYPIILAIGAFYAFVFFLRHIKIDLSSGLLLARMIILAIPLFYTDELIGYLGNYFAVIISAFIYLVCSNLKNVNQGRSLKLLAIAIGALVSLQVIYRVVSILPFGFNAEIIKASIYLPIGRSNMVASYLLMCFLFLYVYLKASLLKTSTLSILFVGLFLTMSRGALISLTILLFFTPAMLIRTRKGPFIIVIIIGLLVLGLAFPNIVETYVTKGRWFPGSSIDDISRGRLELYKYNFDKFLRYPVFGNGLGFPEPSISLIESYRPHNLVLEALTQGGIANFLVFFLALYVAMKKIHRYAGIDKTQAGIFISTVSIIIHGMIEPNLFSFSMDALFWAFIGMGVSRYKAINALNVQ